MAHQVLQEKAHPELPDHKDQLESLDHTVGKEQREKRATQVLLVWTCQGLRERREPPGSRERQVLKDCQGRQAYQAGMD